MNAPPLDPLHTPTTELSAATHIPAPTGVIAPAVNENPGVVPEPDRVAGYKRGSSKTRIVNDKSTKLHTAVSDQM